MSKTRAIYKPYAFYARIVATATGVTPWWAKMDPPIAPLSLWVWTEKLQWGSRRALRETANFTKFVKITKILNFGKNRGMRFNLNLNLKLKTWIEPKSSVNASLGWDFLKFTRSFLSTYFSFLQLTSYFFIEVN